MANIEYTYNVEELDKIIDKMMKGISVMVSDEMMAEVQLRYKELQAELDGEELDVDDEDVQRHRAMKEHVEKKRRSARRTDVMLVTLSAEQKAQIHKEMSSAYVRTDPNSYYNKSDDQMHDSAERRRIYEKLSKLKNCYYNPEDYKNAIKIIREAIMYSLEHDHPFLTKEEAIRQFNAGTIRFKYCNIPKLFINYQTMVTDPDILKGVVTGEVRLQPRDNAASRHVLDRNKHANYNPIHCDYVTVTNEAFDNMVQMHKQGYDTPASTLLNGKKNIYGRFSLPSTNRFASSNADNNNRLENLQFDWTREDAAREYFELVHGKKNTVVDTIRKLNAANDNALSNSMITDAMEFYKAMTAFRHGQSTTQQSMQMISNALQPNPEAVQIEQQILNAIRLNNPNL